MSYYGNTIKIVLLHGFGSIILWECVHSSHKGKSFTKTFLFQSNKQVNFWTLFTHMERQASALQMFGTQST